MEKFTNKKKQRNENNTCTASHGLSWKRKDDPRKQDTFK